MKVTLQYVNAPSSDTHGTTLLLRFDDRRYLFGNICEGTQRAFVENGIRLGKVNDIFLTGRTEWKNTGGLIGLLLTAADVQAGQREALNKARVAKAEKLTAEGSGTNGEGKGKRKLDATEDVKLEQSFSLTIHGSKNLLNTIATARSFVYRQDMSLNIHEFDFNGFDEYPSFKDSHVTIHPIGVTPVKMELKYAAREEVRHKGPPRRLSQPSIPRFFEQKASLSKVLHGMFNMKSGSLEVKREDTDYLKSLIQRIEDDHERKALASGQESKRPVNEDSSVEPVISLGSPIKKMKLSTDSEMFREDDETISHPSVILKEGKPLKRPWPATTVADLPHTTPSPTSVSYIVSFPPTRGKFLPNQAKALGVEPGPNFSKLSKGETIVTASGSTVYPKDVMEPDVTIPSVAIIEIPSVEYVRETLTEIQMWRDDAPGRQIRGWSWILGKDVEKDVKLLAFIRDNPGEHAISSPTACPDEITYQGAAAQMTRLNMLDNRIYALPYRKPINGVVTTQKIYVGTPETSDTLEPPKYTPVQRLLEYEVYPRQKLVDTKVAKAFDFAQVKNEITNMEGSQYVNLTAEVKKDVAKLEAAGSPMGDVPGKEVEIWTLGTGSALPSKYRNVSANVLHLPEVGNILFDCGENTLGQLRRLLRPQDGGKDEYDTFFFDLKCIYISHMHADHHLGTNAVIKAWYELNAPRKRILYVVGPMKMYSWLKEYTLIEDIGMHHIKFINCENFLPDRTFHDKNLVQAFKEHLCLSELTTSPALHCIAAYTTAWTFDKPKGFKFAYSGDTRPTPGFVTIGKGATLLLHEATFDDELKAEAVAKRHSTTAEAIGAANAMGARAVLLTHFSQRYPKLPVIENTEVKAAAKEPLADTIGEDVLTNTGVQDEMEIDEAPSINDGPVLKKPKDGPAMKIGLAFDLQRVKMRDFWKLETFIPALRELFKEEAKIAVDETETPVETEKPLSKSQLKKQQKQQAQAETERPMPKTQAKKPQKQKARELKVVSGDIEQGANPVEFEKETV